MTSKLGILHCGNRDLCKPSDNLVFNVKVILTPKIACGFWT
jgi:hypothetical protein